MTELGLTRSDRVVLWGGLSIAGVVLGWFAPPLARLAVEHAPVLPFGWGVRLVQDAPNWLTAVAGVVIGLALSSAAERETPLFTVTDEHVRLRKKGTTRTYRREQIHAVWLDDKQLVLEAAGGTELSREKPEGRPEQIEQAFRTHRYPWLELQR